MDISKLTRYKPAYIRDEMDMAPPHIGMMSDREGAFVRLSDIEAALTREAPTEGVAEYQYRCPKASDDGWRRMTLEQYEATLATGNACGERGWTRDVEVRRLYATPPAPQRQSSNPSGLSSESAALSSEQRLAQGEDARYVEDGDLLWLSRRLGVIDRDYGIHVVKRGGTGDVGDLLSFVTYMRGCNDV